MWFLGAYFWACPKAFWDVFLFPLASYAGFTSPDFVVSSIVDLPIVGDVYEGNIGTM